MTVIYYTLYMLLVVNVLYILIFAIAGHFRKASGLRILSAVHHKIVVLIPAYKEDQVILQSAKDALKQHYPAEKFEVCVIADQLKPDTITALSKLPIRLMEAKFEKSSKAKALNMALSQLTGFDVAVVLDADNHMKPDFLDLVNDAYHHGHKAIQGKRIAKNANNELAVLDGISEAINNHLFRKGHQALGLSSALIGSGMAFDFDLFKAYMQEINALGGFDKQLEVNWLKDGHKIYYAEEAIILDEKVDNRDNFTRQRTRWIAAQIRYGLQSFLSSAWLLVTKGNVDVFDKSFQFLLLPRLILIGSVGAFSFISLFTPFWMSGVALFGFNALALLLSIPKNYWSKRLFHSALHLPQLFADMVLATLSFRKATNNFLHTPHKS